MVSDPRPPSYLSRSARSFWRATVAAYELEPHHLRLLALALEASDRAEQAREALAESGIVCTDRYGKPRAHPLVSVERDARLSFARLMRELDLEGDALPSPRPPRGR
ncbi:hypothetical protein BH20ACT9_BH20ACT9_06050 [soil metagenome]